MKKINGRKEKISLKKLQSFILLGLLLLRLVEVKTILNLEKKAQVSIKLLLLLLLVVKPHLSVEQEALRAAKDLVQLPILKNKILLQLALLFILLIVLLLPEVVLLLLVVEF